MRYIKPPSWRNIIGRIPDIKRIQKTDFEQKYQALIEKLSFPINSFFEQTRSALDHNIDFTNLNQEIITLDVVVDATGVPTTNTQYRSTLRTKVIGNTTINALNISGTAGFPTGQPFITFSQTDKLVTILNVTGLPANTRYRLIIISIGQ